MSLEEVRTWTRAHSPPCVAPLPGHIPFAEAAKGSLLSAVEEADGAESRTSAPSTCSSGWCVIPRAVLAAALLAQGVEPQRVRAVVTEILGDGPTPGA